MDSCAACRKPIQAQYCGEDGTVTFCTECMRQHCEAVAEGLKDETCPRCSAVFYAHIHFVRCENRPCPMISTKDPRSILERLADKPPVIAEQQTGDK